MGTIVNAAILRRSLDQEPFERVDTYTEARRVYLGSVLNLAPSGKYYTPFACSNVTEEEAEKDELFFEQLEAELESIGCFLESSEGDPCDLFATESRDVEDPDTDLLAMANMG